MQKLKVPAIAVAVLTVVGLILGVVFPEAKDALCGTAPAAEVAK